MATKRTISKEATDKQHEARPADQTGRAIADGQLQGEGNVEAARHYNEATRRFVGSGKVAAAARAAAPSGDREAAALSEAERKGKRRAKGEDPQVARTGAGKK
jgi:hypothetical protein